MGMFVEVESLDKNCTVIINLDHIVEVAPLVEGGCALFFNDGAAVNGIRSMKVKDNYSMFKQFALQTVSAEDVAKKIASLKPSKAPSHAEIRKAEIKAELAAKSE